MYLFMKKVSLRIKGVYWLDGCCLLLVIKHEAGRECVKYTEQAEDG